MFTKYPSTPHLPWSPGVSRDDSILKDLSHFVGKRVIASKKMDGETTTGYSNGHVHARSIDSRGGEDRAWVKSMFANIAHNMPENWRICGENLWAKHSIYYDSLPSYFMGFSIWNEDNVCLSWDDTVQYFQLLGIESVPVIYDGVWDEVFFRCIHNMLDPEKDEGFVVRLADSYHYDDFARSIAKFVREGHVQTDKHWRHQKIVPNGLK